MALAYGTVCLCKQSKKIDIGNFRKQKTKCFQKNWKLKNSFSSAVNTNLQNYVCRIPGHNLECQNVIKGINVTLYIFNN